MSNNDKVAVIFGGSSGIGKAITLGLAENGSIVVPVSRTQSKVNDVVEELKSRGLRCLGLTANVTNKKEVEKVLDTVLEEFGHVNSLINSAGTHLKKKSIEITEEEWDHVLDVNLKGTFFTCQVFGKQMIKQKQGAIVNIASLAAHVALLEITPYCASKGGVVSLTKALAIEWAKYNVRVNCISPGFFRTPLNEKVLAIPERYERIISHTPFHRLGKTSELVGAAIYLTSDASSFVTGTNITVDGGFLAWGI
ncbi:MAG: SDR family NAD(P)-dependent oxidoreductase [Promethearchaeota archaeon]